LGVRRITNPQKMQFNAFTKGEHDDSSPDFGHLFPGRPIVRVEKYPIGSGTDGIKFSELKFWTRLDCIALIAGQSPGSDGQG
jgi:hypothetical protein